MTSTLLTFNTVERLMRGDFFHCVRGHEVVAELATMPASWPIVGLGTTNRLGRHGEVFIDGTAGAPVLRWADPESDPPSTLSLLDLDAPLPFVGVAVCDPDGPVLELALGEGADVHAAVAARCAEHNVGLAAIRMAGELREVAYQVMCHIPIGGIAEDRPAVAHKASDASAAWHAVGMYAANPTIQSVLSHGVAAVHLHGWSGEPGHGGHVNGAIATGSTTVEVRPVDELVVRIRDLSSAVRAAPTT